MEKKTMKRKFRIKTSNGYVKIIKKEDKILQYKIKKYAIIKILAINFGVVEFTVKGVPDLHFFTPIENLKYNFKLI